MAPASASLCKESAVTESDWLCYTILQMIWHPASEGGSLVTWQSVRLEGRRTEVKVC